MENEKHVNVSFESSGLSFDGLMSDTEWESWKKEVKEVTSKILGYQVGEPELGEIDY